MSRDHFSSHIRKQVWLKKYNERRREAYRNDPELRERIKAANRRSYRRRHEVKVREVASNEAMLNMGQERFVPELDKSLLTFSIPEASRVFGLHEIMLYRWIIQNKFPRAKWVVGRRKVYTLEEMQALADVLRKHFDRTPHFRASDKDVIEKLYSIVYPES